jgi:hypothetical protein
LGLVFKFCAPGLVFDGTQCVGSRFHILRARTHFWRYRGRRVPFSCFALPDSCSVIPWASGPVFMYYAPGLFFNSTEGVGSRFHFFALPWASCPVFMFCSPGLIFNSTEGVGSRFHVLRSRSHFRGYRGSWVPFSCFARSDWFSTVPSASGPVFIFCELGLIFDGIEGTRSRFPVLRSRTRL